MQAGSPLWIIESTGNDRFPYRLRIEREGRTIVALRVQAKWPGQKGHVFCIREQQAPDDLDRLEEIERVPVQQLSRYGKKLSVVLDRPTRKRCDFLFIRKNYRSKPGSYEQIFFRTQSGLREHRSRTRRQLFDLPGMTIAIDSSERYPWSFSNARVHREKLPAGDYALLEENRYAAVIERKTFDNLMSDFGALQILHAKLAELGGYEHCALVVEAQYGDFLDEKRVAGRWQLSHIARSLGELQALHPSVPFIFAGNRKMANIWARGFFQAVAAHRRHQEIDTLPLEAAEEELSWSSPAQGDTPIRKAVMEVLPSPFSFAALREQEPEFSPNQLRRVLNRLREQGLVYCSGKGRAALWYRR